MSKPSKFLFDLNNFDEKQEPSEEDLIPTFSEEELQAARQEGYDQGKQDGIAQEIASREERLTKITAQIQQAFSMIVAEEYLREQQYEEEAVRIFQVGLKKLFPELNRRLGLEELKAALIRILQGQANSSKIIIRVASDISHDIEALLQSRITKETNRTTFNVIGDDDIEEGSCRLRWEDGGAVRDAQKLINEMIIYVDSLFPEPAGDSIALQIDDINENAEDENVRVQKHDDGDLQENITPEENGEPE